MVSLLHIEASPRGPGSHSSAAAHVFLSALRAVETDLAIDRLQLRETDLLPF